MAPYWSAEKWIDVLSKSGGQKNKFQYCLTPKCPEKLLYFRINPGPPEIISNDFVFLNCLTDSNSNFSAAQFVCEGFEFLVFKIQSNVMRLYMCMCCGLLTPTQFHFACCCVRDDPWQHADISICACECVYICLCTCIYVYVIMYMCIYVNVCMYMCVRLYVLSCCVQLCVMVNEAWEA